MVQRLLSNPLWDLFKAHKTKNSFNAISALILILFATTLEGASFAALLLSFASIGQDGDVKRFTLFMLAAVAAQLLRSTCTYLGQIATMRLTVRLQNEAQNTIYHKIFHFTFSAVHRYKIGDLIHYVTAPPNYFRLLTEALNRATVAALMIVVYLAIMAWVSAGLTACVLLLFGIGALLQKTLIRKISNASHHQSEEMVKLNEETAQNLSGLKTIHLFDHQNYLLRVTRGTLQRIGAASLRLNKWNQLVQPVNEAIAVVLVAASLILGLYFLRAEEYQLLPLLMTFLALTYRLGMRLQVCMLGIGEVAYYIGPIKRLREILDDTGKDYIDRAPKPSACFEQSVDVESLSFSYPGADSSALSNISFSIPKGEVTAFVGHSGGGKSTLLDLLLRLYEPTEGKILVDGQPIDAFSLESWRKRFGVVSQDPFLFHDTIEANIRFGALNATRAEVEEAARLAGADRVVNRLDMGYGTVVGERGHRLSGGERQRIALARALVRKPDILVLDEATSNLDSQSERVIQEALERLRGKMTLVVVAHRLATIHEADQIIVLEEGEIVEQGSHTELLRREGSYHHLWSLQTGAMPLTSV